nr:MAG TPA: hypothetical protein [Caudoviricetes sp.]
MTRIIVSVIKSAVFILGIVLASCFIGRGANSRMKHVVGVQQRFIARRDPRNCSRLLLYWQGCELQDEARCWCSAAFHRAP